MDMATWVQILYKAVYISHIANTLGKGMNPTIPPSAMGKIGGQSGVFSLGKENFEYKPVKLC